MSMRTATTIVALLAIEPCIMLACYALPTPRQPWAIDAQGREIPVAHSEQGDFCTITAPDEATAQYAASLLVSSGMVVEWVTPTTIRTQYNATNASLWNGLRQRLTTCVVSCGAESKGEWIGGAEG
jgi:hypothetical protein